MDNEIEREIDLRQMFYHILQRWRFIIVCLIIGILVLGGYSVVRNISISTAVSEVTSAKNDIDGQTAKGYLSEARCDYVESVADMIFYYRDLVEQQKNYNENALYMQLDPYNVVTGQKKYYIDNNQTTEWNNALFAICEAYATALKSLETGNILEEKLAGVDGWSWSENNPDYYRDLITVSYGGGGNVNDGDGILSVEVIGKSKELISAILNIANDIINENQAYVRSNFGDHAIKVVGEDYYTTTRSDIRDTQVENRQKVLDYEDKIENYISSITDTNEKAYLNYLIEIEADDYYTEPENMGRVVFGYVGVKYLLIGAVLGIIVAIILVAIKYACASYLKSCDELESTLRIQMLSRFDTEDSDFAKKHRTKLDKWLRNKKLHNKDVMGYAESIELAAAKILIASEKEGLKKVCIATDLICDDKYANDIIAKLDGKIETICVSNFLAKSEALQDLSGMDGVVLIEQLEVSRFQEIIDETKICSKFGLNVIGAIVLQ